MTLVKRMEEMKIFKGVDLQQMISRFNEEREFIRMAGREESIEPPEKSIHDTWLSVFGITDEKSIHDTWLSVFGITDEMLKISREELETYLQYLRAVDLIVACKEAAGRVSPEVWQEIEKKLLSWRICPRLSCSAKKPIPKVR